ncbi:MAG TPA: hypothetical protein VK762_20445 [Polyangiaceae bacterium]|jgi:hypothetical protein|nr:hypothetical protein [Polyangiaceae bacterium]
MLKIDETITASGEPATVHVVVEEGGLAIVADGEKYALADVALDAVMRRFGAPLEPAEPIAVVATLDLGGGRALRHVRHLGRYDVIARDYLVYDVPGREPSCALATTVAGALVHLGRATAPSP